MSEAKRGKQALKRKVSEAPLDALTNLPAAKQRMVVTPWLDTKEFCDVYDCLFQDISVAKSRKALSRMRIWNLRRGSLCPAAVLATAVLVNAQLEDMTGKSNIQNTYASAFTRFFNFMSSIMQNYNMTSMYDTAKKLGLQSFIVDLRHLCAHGQELPPAVVLSRTAHHCLEWLRNYYWLPQAKAMSNLDAPKLQRKDNAKLENELKALFEIYDLALECELKGAQRLKSISRLKTSAEFNKLRVYSSAKNIKSTKEILDNVVTDLGAAIKRQSSSIKDTIDIYIAGVLRMKYFIAAGLQHVNDEELVIDATQALFRLFAMQGYIENVFVAFVQLAENGNASDDERRGASYWATKMLQTFEMLSRMKRMYKEELDSNPSMKAVNFSTLNKGEVSKTLRSLLIHSGMDLSLTLVFGEGPKKPRSWVFERDYLMDRMASLNIYTVPIVKELVTLVDPPLTDEQLKDFTILFNLKKEIINGKKRIDANPSVDTSEDDNCENSDDTQFGIWTVAKEGNWSTCALGVLPNSTT